MRVTIHHPNRQCSVHYDVEGDLISFTLGGEALEEGRGYTELSVPHLSLKRPCKAIHVPDAIEQAGIVSKMPSVSSATFAKRDVARLSSAKPYLVGGVVGAGIFMLVMLLQFRPADRDSQTEAHHVAALKLQGLERPTASQDLPPHSFASASIPPSPLPERDVDSSPAPGFGMP